MAALRVLVARLPRQQTVWIMGQYRYANFLLAVCLCKLFWSHILYCMNWKKYITIFVKHGIYKLALRYWNYAFLTKCGMIFKQYMHAVSLIRKNHSHIQTISLFKLFHQCQCWKHSPMSTVTKHGVDHTDGPYCISSFVHSLMWCYVQSCIMHAITSLFAWLSCVFVLCCVLVWAWVIKLPPGVAHMMI